MELESVISFLTMAATLSVKLIGFPSQIRKIMKTCSIKDVSLLYFVLGFVTYFLWAVHGYLKGDMIVFFGQGLGVITSGTLLIVMRWVAVRNKKKPGSKFLETK